MVAAGDGRDITTNPKIAREFFALVGRISDRRSEACVAVSTFWTISVFANDRSFDPETLRLLQRVFEEVAATLPDDGQAERRKTILASRILALRTIELSVSAAMARASRARSSQCFGSLRIAIRLP